MTIKERFEHFTEAELTRKHDRNVDMMKSLESENRVIRKLIRAKAVARVSDQASVAKAS